MSLFGRKRSAGRGEGYDYWITATELMSAVMLIFVLIGLVALLRAKDEEQETAACEGDLKICNDKLGNAEVAARELAQCREGSGELKRALDECGVDLASCTQQRESCRQFNEQCSALGDSSRQINEALKSIGGSLDLDVDTKSNTVRLDANLLFPSGSDSLSDEGKAALIALIPKYSAVILMPEVRGSVRRVMIEGHSSRIGSDLLNMRLSTMRALKIYEFLTAGVPPFPEREAFLKLLTPAGRGELDAKGSPNSDLPEDRTVELRIEFFLPLPIATLPDPIRGVAR